MKKINATTKTFGIPPQVAAAYPVMNYVPSGLNPDAKIIWRKVISNTALYNSLRKQSVALAWNTLLNTFVQACEKENINPLKARDDSINDNVRRMLLNRRARVRKYIDDLGVFQICKIVPRSIYHTYTFKKNGCILLRAYIGLEHGDDVTFLKVLKQQGKMFATGSSYQHLLLNNLIIGVEKVTRARAMFFWEVEIRTPYYIPAGKNKLQKERYLDRQFFFPMTRGLRYETLRRRVQF